MTLEAVTCEDLEKTREELVSMIASELTIEERPFVVFIKEGMLQWDLIGIEGVENLSARKPHTHNRHYMYRREFR